MQSRRPPIREGADVLPDRHAGASTLDVLNRLTSIDYSDTTPDVTFATTETATARR